ncbi:hypothetical protein KP509_39G027000 [Ceratopteris richardii]|uniref:F-box domain-containing protein n=1 Tax=Ceratopteris richardii TaxID=49495 RepID=A0A8T2PZT5_CERRI|nr:hypothetical protein KP509_39G027000 [Ceratopteris richardii]KAH7276930.1 hypothetical protein KP509_39G027000 [Ceratopteris richardii]
MANFDSLPDGILCFIFSKLDLAQAVARCSMVCQRWRSICASVDTLTFESFQLFENTAERRKASCIEDVVSRMLLKTNGVRNLKITYHPVVWPWIHNDHFAEVKVCTWLQHVHATLERLTLVDPNLASAQHNRLLYLSSCKRLQWLNLCYAFIPSLPPLCNSFGMLKSCFLDLVVITDSALASFVQLCPSLDSLRLNSCTGLQSPHIRAPNLRCLEFMSNLGCVEPIQKVYAEAPNLQRVFLSYVEELRTEGEGISELELLCHVKPSVQLLPLLSSLYMHGYMWNLESIYEYIRLGPSMKVLHIDVKLNEKRPVEMDQCFGHLQDLKTFYIGSEFFECMQAGAKLTSTSVFKLSLPMLEDLTVAVTRGNKQCITILASFLRCSSSLKRLHVNAESLENCAENVSFFTHMLALQRSYLHVEILLTCPNSLL